MSEPSLRLASLAVLGGPLHGKKFTVAKAAEEILLGSDRGCHFHLPLPGVSPIHARILIGPAGATVHDEGGTRGVFVNTEPVESASLQAGDMLGLGPPQEQESVMIRCAFAERAATPPPPVEAGPSAGESEDELVVVAESEPLVELQEAEVADVAALVPEPTPPEEAPSLPEEAREPPEAAAPPPAAAPPAAESLEDFFIEEPAAPVAAPPPAPAEPAFVEFMEETPAAPPEPAATETPADDGAFFTSEPEAPAPAAPPPEATPAEDTPFFIEDAGGIEQTGGGAAPPPASPELVQSMPAPEEDSFFVEAQEVAPEAAGEVFVAEEIAPPPAPAPPASPAVPPTPAPAPPTAPVARAPSPAKPTVTQREAAPVGSPHEEAPRPAPSAPRRPDATHPRVDAASVPRRPPVSSPRPPAGPRPAARARARPSAPVGRYLGLGALVLAVLVGGAFLTRRLLGAPSLDAVEPTRARAGQTVALVGKGFTAEPEGSVVLFGDKPGTILKASPSRLEVTVPDGVAALGEDVQVPVRVRVGGRDSRPMEITVFQGPTIHGISPDVAMPGDEIVLLGTGWGVGATVKFGAVPGEVLLATDSQIRVRVPPVEGGPGTSVPVVVSMGVSSSNPGPFLIGRVPLLLKVEPSSASPGDVVTISGRGFRRERGQNSVSIGGARALLASALDSELKVVAPWGAGGGGERPIEVRVAGSDNVGRATLAMPPPPEAVDFRFVAEPFEGAPGRDHAILATALGPAFVLSATGGRSAAERAVETQRRLNDAAVLLKASRSADLEMRDLETRPTLALIGRPETLLEVTEEDAAGYNEDWTGQKGRGGAVTRYRLARWWEAVAKDLVLLLVRGEKPSFATALAPEGKVLAEVFQAAQKTGRFGVSYQVVEEEKPATREALRLLALRVPAGVKGLAGEEKAPAATASGPPPLTPQGTWTGSEIEGPSRRWLTIRFTESGGNVSYEGTVTLTVPILSLETLPKSGLRFSVQFRGGIRYYVGTWDGEMLTGKVSTDPAGTQPLATFEIRPR